MNLHLTRSLGLLLASLVCLVASARAGDGDDRPVKVDLVFRFNVKVGPSYFVPPNLPPWYLWFPNEPINNLQSAQSSPYPHWPNAWPPVAGGGRPATNYTSQTPYGGTLTSQGFQPAGPAMQAPSYWSGR